MHKKVKDRARDTFVASNGSFTNNHMVRPTNAPEHQKIITHQAKVNLVPGDGTPAHGAEQIPGGLSLDRLPCRVKSDRRHSRCARIRKSAFGRSLLM